MLAFIAFILSMLLLIVSIGCWIFTIVRAFQSGDAIIGILSIFCALVAFVMGWVNADKWNHRQVMMVWTGVVVVQIILSFVGGAGGVPAIPQQ